ncbi:MAG: hypothetical protein WCF58_10285 [Syntrophobacteraceae bacterium]
MMGLFDGIFNKANKISHREWSLIAFAISKDFEDIRERLFNSCKEAILEFYKIQSWKIDIFYIKSKSYSDDIQGINIKVFQLILSSLLIGRKKYIPSHQGNQFADLLWAQVLGNQILPAVEHGKLLFQKGDTFPRLSTFFCYVAEGITGKINPAIGMLLLSNFGSPFFESCYRTVATAFSDTDIENTILSEMIIVTDRIKILSDRFDAEIKRMTD